MFLDHSKANQKLGCQKLGKVFKIGKTAAANLLKSKKIHEQFRQFQGKNKTRIGFGKYTLRTNFQIYLQYTILYQNTEIHCIPSDSKTIEGALKVNNKVFVSSPLNMKIILIHQTAKTIMKQRPTLKYTGNIFRPADGDGEGDKRKSREGSK